MRVIEYILPNGKQRVHRISHVRRTDRDFFEENRITISYERDGKFLIMYIQLNNYYIRGEAPEELLKILPEKTPIVKTMALCREMAEKYINKTLVEDYRVMRRNVKINL